ncbi:PREDICTED: uncharacterized protein LOC109131442 [Camelina sativa]|uniref:Uncharacterized protein LOC109131442 n=1 Tax=Camelina sativa TaxID=90675 RepID=A0ABM1RGA2_CAMSA|nr:PREDICTED: uncharacterized protein LOC109131442 [Camelina sativa]
MAVGMEPKRELVEMLRCTKLVRIQMLDGNSPEKLFEERSRTRRAGRKATRVSFPDLLWRLNLESEEELWVNIHLSTSLVNEFLLTSMEIKLEQLEMVCGSSPASMLEDRLSSLRNSRFPRDKGTLPEKLFPERSRVSRVATSPIQSGISPARELPRSRIEVQEELIVFIESGRFPDK